MERDAWPLLGLACVAACRPRSWWASLHADLQCAAAATELWEIKPPHDVPGLLQQARVEPTTCRAHIKRALAWAYEVSLGTPARPVVGPTAAADEMRLLFTCNDCTATFSNNVALAVHAAKCHGYRQEARCYAVDNTCSSCLLGCGSRMRLVRRLAKPTSICLYNARRLGLALTAAELDTHEQLSAAQGKDARRAGRRECWSATHTWQALGPAWPLERPPHLLTGRVGNPVLRLAVRVDPAADGIAA